MDTVVISLISLVVLHLIIVAYLKIRGYFDRFPQISLYGPLLMVKTKRGVNLIDRIAAKKRFWRIFGDISLVVLYIMMFFMFFLLFQSALMASSVPKSAAPKPQEVLALPGINPFIPLWYGLFALIIAVVFHEFSHGILSRVGGLKVKALGILIFGVPVGAFVEPDEDELQMAPRRIRDRVYAAGPGMNIFLGITLLLVFSWGFMGSLQPVHDGMLITSVTKDFPAEKAGLRPGMIITHMECTGIRNESNTTRVVSFSSDIRDLNDFYRFMDSTHANDTVNITVYSNGKLIVFSNITLTDKYRYYPIEEFRGKGFLGVSTVDVRGFRDALAHPVASANGNWMIAFGNILQITLFLPLQTTIMPFHSPITEIYTIEGPLSILPPSVFWMLANLLYYTFWLNFLVGTFNALPAVPLDGGIPFRDTVDYLAEKVGRVKDPLKRERIADTMALWMALIVLFLIIWVLFAPYIL